MLGSHWYEADGVKVVGAGVPWGRSGDNYNDTGSAKATPFEELTTKDGGTEYVLRNSRKRNRFHCKNRGRTSY